jgi:uncharacterized protein YbjT (DUF2867 family)
MNEVVLVTGGTGMIGRFIVQRLRDEGRTVRVLTRGNHEPQDGVEYVVGDLATGEGIQAAVDGARTIVHAAGSSKGDEIKAQHLLQAATRASTRHLVYISVVGADRIPVVCRVDRGMFSYFASKLAGERLITESGIPWTILRATQTHDLMLIVAKALSKMPVVMLPGGFHVQPVDTAEVGNRLAELALGDPQGLVPDIGGPKVYKATELLQAYLKASRQHRLTIPVHLPGRGARAFRNGANLTPGRAVGRRTWEEFLVDRVGSPKVGKIVRSEPGHGQLKERLA